VKYLSCESIQFQGPFDTFLVGRDTAAGSGDGMLHAWNINTVQEVLFFNQAFNMCY
jgi:hypothetical protein